MAIPLVSGLGQCCLDHIAIIDKPAPADSKKEIFEWTVEGGGPVATALVALRRFGLETALMGQIADDISGSIIKQGLINEGVDVDNLLTRSGGTSQTAFILVEKHSGLRTIYWARPSGGLLRPEEVNPDVIRRSSFLLVDGLMADASIHAARIARDAGVPIMLDAGRLRDGMEELIPFCDYVVGSKEFSLDLTGGDHRWALKQLRVKGPRFVTITLGINGSYTLANDEMFHQAAYEVDVVDTTGAGDVFHGGYIYALLQGWDIRRTVRFASAVAALKCRGIGGRRKIPSLEEVSGFLEQKAHES